MQILIQIKNRITERKYLVRQAELLGVKPRFWHTKKQLKKKCLFAFAMMDCRALINHAKAVIDREAFWTIGHGEAVDNLPPKLKKLFKHEVEGYEHQGTKKAI